MRCPPWVFAASVLAMAVPAPAAELPRVSLDGGKLVVSGLPGVLARPEVRPHLDSGLTTTFVLQVSAGDAKGGKAQGGATITVRWEPWDEVYLVAAAGAAGGAVRRESLPSRERLDSWWRDLRLPVLDPGALGREGDWRVQVSVHVVPFSEAEREDTQRWFSASVASGQRSNAQDASAAAKHTAASSLVLDLWAATSIRRRSLVSYDWNLTYRPSRGPEPKP
jgi:hypothetical protein